MEGTHAFITAYYNDLLVMIIILVLKALYKKWQDEPRILVFLSLMRETYFLTVDLNSAPDSLNPKQLHNSCFTVLYMYISKAYENCKDFEKYKIYHLL